MAGNLGFVTDVRRLAWASSGMKPLSAMGCVLRHGDGDRPADVAGGDQTTEGFEDPGWQRCQAEEEYRETQKGGDEHERARMVVARRACRGMMRIVFRPAPCQAEKEGDGAQRKGRQRDSKA